ESGRIAFGLLARHTGGDAEHLARSALAIAVEKLRRTIERLIADYAFEPNRITIVGGGGGAGVLVPALAAAMRLPHRIARDAEVIAPVGVALALVRDVVERTIFAPTPHEIAAIRREAADRAIAAGAAPDSVEVEVEIDVQRSRVTAAASGASALVESAASGAAGAEERRLAAAQSLDCDPAQLVPVELTDVLNGFARTIVQRGRFGRTRAVRDVRVVDERGVVRLALRDPALVRITAGAIEARVRAAIENATEFGDVGRALPALYVLRGGRIAAFEGLTGAEQAAALAAEETEGCRPDATVTLLLVARSA
ncbi:MAG TPA: hydantoinase/oxoprolinase family protein, partial [Candidatus Cybelea sp.]